MYLLAMQWYRYQSLRKVELIEKFYSLVPGHFNTIKNFATFRGINVYQKSQMVTSECLDESFSPIN